MEIKFKIDQEQYKVLNNFAKYKDCETFIDFGNPTYLVALKETNYVRTAFPIKSSGDGIIRIDMKQMLAICKSRDVSFVASDTTLKFSSGKTYTGSVQLVAVDPSVQDTFDNVFKNSGGQELDKGTVACIRSAAKKVGVSDPFQKESMIRSIDIRQGKLVITSGGEYHLAVLRQKIVSDVKLTVNLTDAYINHLEPTDLLLNTDNIFYVDTGSTQVVMPLTQDSSNVNDALSYIKDIKAGKIETVSSCTLNISDIVDALNTLLAIQTNDFDDQIDMAVADTLTISSRSDMNQFKQVIAIDQPSGDAVFKVNKKILLDVLSLCDGQVKFDVLFRERVFAYMITQNTETYNLTFVCSTI